MAQSADIVVPPVTEEIVDAVQTASEKEIVEVFQLSPQERIQEGIVKHRVKTSVPPDKEETAEVLQPRRQWTFSAQS